MTDPIPLRQRIAAAIHRYDNHHALSGNDIPSEHHFGEADFVLAELRTELDALAALRAVARGYCPACGRGDVAPTVEDWEQQKQRADQAEETSRRLLEQRQEMAEERYAWQQRGDRAERDARIYRDRLERLTDGYAEQFHRLEAVRKLRDDMRGSSDTRWFADQLDGALGIPPGPAATQATDTTKEN